LSTYHLLTTHTYNHIYETELRPILSFLIIHKFYQIRVHSKDSVHSLIFRNQSTFTKICNIFVSDIWRIEVLIFVYPKCKACRQVLRVSFAESSVLSTEIQLVAQSRPSDRRGQSGLNKANKHKRWGLEMWFEISTGRSMWGWMSSLFFLSSSCMFLLSIFWPWREFLSLLRCI